MRIFHGTLCRSDKSTVNNPDQLQAYVKLLTRHQEDIRAFIASLIPGSSDVGDILQETNVVLWMKRDDFEPGTNFIAWSFAIARLQVLKQRSRAKREGELRFSDKFIEAVSGMSPPAVLHEEYLSALERCMAKLTTYQRNMITSRYSSGRSLREFAENNGESPASLRSTLLRLRKALRKCIEQQGLEGFA